MAKEQTSKQDKKPSEKEEVKAVKQDAPAETKPETIDPWRDLKKNISLLEKSTAQKDLTKISRVLRLTTRVRKHVTKATLKKAVELYVEDSNPQKQELLRFVSALQDPPVQAMEVDSDGPAPATDGEEKKPTIFLPEVEIYLHFVILTKLVGAGSGTQATAAAVSLINRATALNRRSLDVFSARAYSLYSLLMERQGKAHEIRSLLLGAHRTACLRHDEFGQATLVNLLLRNYLQYNLVDQAYKLLSKTNFPESVSNNQFVRYLYYVGRIQAVQLDYSEAFTKLTQSIRKAPQNTALGFRIAVQKLAIIVQLLMGEIPERSIFYQTDLKKHILAYQELTQAVRVGSLPDFNQVLQRHEAEFRKDKNFSLILRLRHNVIKTGLRKINTSYSRISFQDICTKLGLDTAQNAEYVCAKAIKDGVIDAVISHDEGWMQSKEFVDIYVTTEPQQAFHKRITFCLDVHNEAVKAMQYPPDAYKKELESAEQRQEREKTEEEIAKEIEDEMDEEGL